MGASGLGQTPFESKKVYSTVRLDPESKDIKKKFLKVLSVNHFSPKFKKS